MSTYKKLNKQDAYITTYTAHKSWTISGSQFAEYGIEFYPNTRALTPVEALTLRRNPRSLPGQYLSSSLKQLYYPQKTEEGTAASHSFDYYDQTTLNNPDTRNFSPNSCVISIPRALTGTGLNKGVGLSFIVRQVQQLKYVADDYWTPADYTDDPLIFVNVDTLGIDDDGEGGLYVSGSNPRNYVGDIIYPHGMFIITDRRYANRIRTAFGRTNSTPTLQNLELTWQSSQPIFTHNYHCKVRESEYNFTYNPTALSSSIQTVRDNNNDIYNQSANVTNGYLNNNITGSSFQPYITTIGLYNDANQLIAVGKMSQPVPKPANTEMTIIVKIDI